MFESLGLGLTGGGGGPATSGASQSNGGYSFKSGGCGDAQGLILLAIAFVAGYIIAKRVK